MVAIQAKVKLTDRSHAWLCKRGGDWTYWGTLGPARSSTWLTKSLWLLLPLLNRNLFPQWLNLSKYSTFDRLGLLILHKGQVSQPWRLLSSLPDTKCLTKRRERKRQLRKDATLEWLEAEATDTIPRYEYAQGNGGKLTPQHSKMAPDDKEIDASAKHVWTCCGGVLLRCRIIILLWCR